MSTFIDLSGKKFGQLIVVPMYIIVNKRTYWYCICSCGNPHLAEAYCIKSGNTKSCGCFKSKVTSDRKIKHGLRNHPLYTIWSAMKERCNNPKNPAYKNYGGRGISICDEWHSSFTNYYDWCIKNKWAKGLEIDRIDNQKGYSPDNCRITTRQINSRNRSTNVKIPYQGEIYYSWELAKLTGISAKLLLRRLNTYKWSIEKVMNTPNKKQNHD